MLSTYAHWLTGPQISAIRSYAESAFPQEACGFVLADGAVVECRNTSTEPNTFVIAAADSVRYLDDAVVCWHSHGNYAQLSTADITACKALALPYAVWDCGSSQLLWLDPNQSAGLLGRVWSYGGHDCYSAVRDWFYQEQAVVLNDYPRQFEGEWATRGFTHFEDNFEAEGFRRLPPTADLQRGDVLLMRIRNDYTCNHVAVVDDPAANQLYQHLVNRLSGHTSFSPYFRDQTYAVLRRHG